MGELTPCKGQVRRSPHARYALVNQHHADQIDMTMTPLEFLTSKFPGDGSYEHMQSTIYNIYNNLPGGILQIQQSTWWDI